MSHRLPAPSVHGAWTARWWGGDPDLAAIFGPAPSPQALAEVASKLEPAPGWTRALRDHPDGPPPEEALVVLAGQQPVLGGGPALVAHKAATAVALAHHLTETWDRPVVPVFLLATQDHDTTEIDHLDLFNGASGALLRLRVGIEPRHESFFKCSWDQGGLDSLYDQLETSHASFSSTLRSLCGDQEGLSVPEHPARLIEEAFGALGLRLVEAHRLPTPTRILEQALSAAGDHARLLGRGAARLADQGLRASFDPGDDRPLLLESRRGRRRRIASDDAGAALARLASRPESASPHAALRPIVQACSLPVVAQVAGPSEILYLGQARAMHEEFDVTAPVLIPRLEATRVDAEQMQRAHELPPDRWPWDGADPVAPPREALERSLDAFQETLAALDPALAPRLARFGERIRHQVGRLAEAPTWHGRLRGNQVFLRPRGRPQDAVLAWAPEAWRHGDPAAWARHLVALGRPLDPPVHVLYEDPHHG